ncbi:acetylornithine deacetylase [Acidocella aquatica]|uniref:Acetylornithine deacetylase n=1 Tax=Acidocella aquatica TaxID=1922313 RepID=A0ABQ6AA94_9PROT|nr:acetylornithine deacetylase [Acidocella aquatica]GLR67049.1 acetylornithine deacetylase [Acidocella aquatica]
MDTLSTLAGLVAFPTVSRDSNHELIAYIAARLAAAGGNVREIPGNIPGKSNLFASFGPTTGQGIILSGHSDVVPASEPGWITDPFHLSARGDRLYARGASDMKGFIASMITLAEQSKSIPLTRPLHLAISYDEEIGCVGVRHMLQRLEAEGFQAAGCIIGEPTGLRVATGHKGKIAGCICCRGESAHSADPSLGCNAINLASAMIQETEALQTWLRDNGANDSAYAFPHSSVHIGTIKGGTVLNIIPERCDMDFEIRHLPGDDPAMLLERLRARAAALTQAVRGSGRRASIEVRVDNEYPGLETPENSPIATRATQASGNAETIKISFGTEAGLFTKTLGLPCVVCGPGSIDRAHKPNEYILREELDACDRFLRRVVQT